MTKFYMFKSLQTKSIFNNLKDHRVFENMFSKNRPLSSVRWMAEGSPNFVFLNKYLVVPDTDGMD